MRSGAAGRSQPPRGTSTDRALQALQGARLKARLDQSAIFLVSASLCSLRRPVAVDWTGKTARKVARRGVGGTAPPRPTWPAHEAGLPAYYTCPGSATSCDAPPRPLFLFIYLFTSHKVRLGGGVAERTASQPEPALSHSPGRPGPARPCPVPQSMK